MAGYQRSPFLQNILETAQLIKSGAEEEKARKLAAEQNRQAYLQKLSLQQQAQGARAKEQQFNAKLGLLSQLAANKDFTPESKKPIYGAMANLVTGAENVPVNNFNLQEKTVPVPDEIRKVFGNLLPENVPEYKMKQILDAYQTLTAGQRNKAMAGYYGQRKQSATEAARGQTTMVDVPGYGKIPVKYAGGIANLIKANKEKVTDPTKAAQMLDTNMKQIEGENANIQAILMSDDPKGAAKRFGKTVDELAAQYAENEVALRELRKQYYDTVQKALGVKKGGKTEKKSQAIVKQSSKGSDLGSEIANIIEQNRQQAAGGTAVQSPIMTNIQDLFPQNPGIDLSQNRIMSPQDTMNLLQRAAH